MYVSSVTHTEDRRTVRLIIVPVHVSFVSKGTCQRRTLLNRKRSIFYESNWIGFDWWKHTTLRPIGKPRINYCQGSLFFRSEYRSISRNSRLTTTIVDESNGVHGRVRAAASLCFVLAAQARKLSLSASLGWAEEAQKRHARNSDGDAAIIEVLCYCILCVFGRFACLSWHLVFDNRSTTASYDRWTTSLIDLVLRSLNDCFNSSILLSLSNDRAGGKIGLATAMIFF